MLITGKLNCDSTFAPHGLLFVITYNPIKCTYIYNLKEEDLNIACTIVPSKKQTMLFSGFAEANSRHP